MKLCFLGDSNSVHTVRVAAYFAERGHEVSLIGFNAPKIKKVKYYPLKKLFSFMDLNYLANIPLLNKYLAQIKPEVLHAHYVTSYGFMAACSGFQPVVLSCWGSDILVTPKKNIFLKLLTRYILRKVDYLTFDSDPVRTVIRKIAGGRLRARLIVFGVESSFLKLKRPGRGKNRIIISVRSLEPLYNIDKIIKAFNLVKDKIKNVRLIVVGEGTLKKDLQLLSDSLKLKKYVSFLGSQPRYKLAEILSLSDIFVAVPESDATSISLIEAMAVGVVPVVSNIDSKTYLIKDGVNGYTLEVGHTALSPITPEGIAAKIIEALKNEKQNDFIISTNKILVEKFYLFDKNMGQLEKIYKDLKQELQ
ncbi:MAG: glycosyltransferase family 4 protein [Candidatus Firestonebacteria bacterium]